MRLGRIAFVHIIASATHAPNHGVAAIAACLLNCGVSRDKMTCYVLDIDDLEKAPQSILQDGADFVFISFMSNQLENVLELTISLKRLDEEIIIICGGHHISSVGYEPRLSHIDYQIPGEVDLSIGDVLSRLKLKVHDTLPSMKQVSSYGLDVLPLPQIDLFTPQLWRKYPSVMFSRGCPYSCSYCLSRKGGYEGAVRWKSPERAIEEINQIISYANPSEIYIDDDTLLKNPKWVLRFASLYKRDVELPFYCNARPGTLKISLVEALYDSGCAGIGIGIESGSERIRREILLRPMSDALILKAFKTVKQAGLISWSFNMIGIPTETVEDFKKTILLNERCEVDFVRASIFTEFPGMTRPILGVKPTMGSAAYIRSLDSLDHNLRDCATQWLMKLSAENRLWLTKSELEQMGFRRTPESANQRAE